MLKTLVRGILVYMGAIPIESKEKMSEFKVTIKIIQNAQGEDVITNSFPNLGGIDEKTFHAYEEEASRILSDNPAFIPLFQNGAVLKVGVRGPNPHAEFPTSFMGIQVIGIPIKNVKDTRREYGVLGISRLRTKDIPFCSFDVRLVSL